MVSFSELDIEVFQADLFELLTVKNTFLDVSRPDACPARRERSAPASVARGRSLSRARSQLESAGRCPGRGRSSRRGHRAPGRCGSRRGAPASRAASGESSTTPAAPAPAPAPLPTTTASPGPAQHGLRSCLKGSQSQSGRVRRRVWFQSGLADGMTVKNSFVELAEPPPSAKGSTLAAGAVRRERSAPAARRGGADPLLDAELEQEAAAAAAAEAEEQARSESYVQWARTVNWCDETTLRLKQSLQVRLFHGAGPAPEGGLFHGARALMDEELSIPVAGVEGKKRRGHQKRPAVRRYPKGSRSGTAASADA